ncbi:Dihydrofolate reductase [Candida viswanathii]|uniref:Dihydrofolate reductase n=1 Tax=Candida viswanathii TaxID=5486 RepID=A0A367YIR1_9ASCO|nr:Dihydrofolate reductase [Candida viswanathii]
METRDHSTGMQSKPVISIIVAALKPSLGIGNQGKMPWRLREEIRYFKDVTSKTTTENARNAVIMGRKTWESIPTKFRPLPDRLNIILSRSYNNEIIDENVIHANSIESSLRLVSNVERVFIIGGAEIYNELIKDPLVTQLLITEIEHPSPESVEMDTFLKFPLEDWTKQPKSELQKFIGDKIAIDDDIKEGDFTYNYTLWTRK